MLKSSQSFFFIPFVDRPKAGGDWKWLENVTEEMDNWKKVITSKIFFIFQIL